MKTKLYLLCAALIFTLGYGTVQAQTITTVAGNGTFTGPSGDGGPATAATLIYPNGIAVDFLGNMYIADRYAHCVRKIDPGGFISTVAGIGGAGSSGDGGPATAAALNGPMDVACDAMGNVYIADTWNNRIRKITVATGIISRYAGSTAGFGGDGGPATAISALLDNPLGITIDQVGDMYIADGGNHKVRKISASTGNIGTLTAITPYLVAPSDVAVNSAGDLYVADQSYNKIFKLSAMGVVSTVAGTTSIAGYTGDNGPATNAQLNEPMGVELDEAGNVYICDMSNNVIRKVNTAGIITTFAGTGTADYTGDNGPATAATLYSPFHMAINSRTMYIADADNSVVRKISLAGGYPYFTHWPSITLAVCQNDPATLIDFILTAYDTSHTGTDTWAIVTAPANGAVSGPATATPNGGNINPAGITYMPTAGFTGSDNFKIRVSNAAHADTMTVHVMVQPTPSAGSIGGPTEVCAGASISLSSSGATGGTWSVGSGLTVNSSGVATGTMAGISVVTYIVATGGCGDMAIQTITVNAMPEAGSINGASSVCEQATITLTDATTGGTWTASNVNATVAGGVVTGVSAGPVVISYTVTNSCGTATAIHAVTVDPPSVCEEYTPMVNANYAVHIQPNPATHELSIIIADGAYNTATISNSMGQIVMVRELDRKTTIINVQDLAAGVYYIRLSGTNGNLVQKLVKL